MEICYTANSIVISRGLRALFPAAVCLLVTSKDGRMGTEHLNQNQEVSVCFNELEISFLFAEVLSARGMETYVYTDTRAIPVGTKMVTEPYCFARMSEAQKENDCLIVGGQNLEIIPCNAHTLERPLTEEKVELALEQFLVG